MNLTGDNSEVKTEIQSQLSTIIDYTFRGNLGLPSITDVSTAVVNDAHNKTILAIKKAFDVYVDDVISGAGFIATPVGLNSIDHLFNIKRNLKARVEIKKYGSTIDNFVEIDAYVKSVLKNKTITEERLEQLNAYISSLFGE
jgi:hypothetical protein